MTPRTSRSSSPPIKRVKLEITDVSDTIEPETTKVADENEDHDDYDELQCSICLQTTVDRTILPTCSHEFCFECIRLWSEQSRRCPLCTQAIGDYVIHDIRSKYDFRKHYLPPIRSSPISASTRSVREETIRRRRTARERERERRLREEREESDRLQQSISRRKWIYEQNLYAKHVGSNPYTRYRPFPTPAQFAASQDYIKRTTTFLRRELQIWNDLDVEFLTTFIISMMKSIDIRSESAIKLLSEFLDLDTPYSEGERHPFAEHFAHEVYSYLRSPFRDLFVYDDTVEYDAPAVPRPPIRQERRRPRSFSRSRSPPRVERSTYQARHRSPPSSPSLSDRSPRRAYEDEAGPSSRRHELSCNAAPLRSPSPPSTPFIRQDTEPNTLVRMSTADADNAGNQLKVPTTHNDTRVRSEHCRLRDDDEVDQRHQNLRKQPSDRGRMISHDSDLRALSPSLTPHHVHPEVQTPPFEGSRMQQTPLLNGAREDPAEPSLPSRPKKPPRTRNLIQSVQAHLGSGLGFPTQLGLANAPTTRVPVLQSGTASPRSTSPPPSLLARLSDPIQEPGRERSNPTPVVSGREHLDLGDSDRYRRIDIDNSIDYEAPLNRNCSVVQSADLQSRINDMPTAPPSFLRSSEKGTLNSSTSPSTFLRNPRNDPTETRRPNSLTPVPDTLSSITDDLSFHDSSATPADIRPSLAVHDAPLSEARSESRDLNANHIHDAEDPHAHVDGIKLRGNPIRPSSPLNPTSVDSEQESKNANERRARLLSKLLHEKRQTPNSRADPGQDTNTCPAESSRSTSTVNLAVDTKLLTDSVKGANAIKSTSSRDGGPLNPHDLESELGERLRSKARLTTKKRSLEQ